MYFNAEAGNVAFEAWNSNASTIVFDYHQAMRGLPTGIYTLKANARGSQGTPNGNAVVYATTTIEKTASIYNPVYLGIGENEDDMSEYVIDNIFVSDGTLRFGVKSVGVLDNKWTVADDFQLIYCGNENEALGYNASHPNKTSR